MFYNVLNAPHEKLEEYANTTIFPNSTMLINSFLPDYYEPDESDERYDNFRGCAAYEFSTEHYGNTIATEWGLMCGKSAKIKILQVLIT